MVYMSGSKAARNQASIVNRTNVCGGTSKKGGLAPTVGLFLSSNPNLIGATNTQFGLVCTGNFTNPSQSAWRAIRRY
jgi:hypothetical protein